MNIQTKVTLGIHPLVKEGWDRASAREGRPMVAYVVEMVALDQADDDVEAFLMHLKRGEERLRRSSNPRAKALLESLQKAGLVE